MQLSEYLTDLNRIPWFKSVGEPIDKSLHRISAWDEWPGPSSKPTEVLHLRQQAFYDELRVNASSPEWFDHVWESVQSHVLDLASKALSDPLEGDSWNPVSTAGWQAAWTAALVQPSYSLRLQFPVKFKSNGNGFRKAIGHAVTFPVTNLKNQMALSFIDEPKTEVLRTIRAG